MYGNQALVNADAQNVLTYWGFMNGYWALVSAYTLSVSAYLCGDGLDASRVGADSIASLSWDGLYPKRVGVDAVLC